MLNIDQLQVLLDVRYRTGPPYHGVLDISMPTGLWFDDFIKPASTDPSLRVFSGGGWGHRIGADQQGTARDNAMIIRGNPWDPMNQGIGFLFAVRRGSIPVTPVFKTRWMPNKKQVSIKTEDPARVRTEGLTMWHDSWPNVTTSMLRRGIIRPTKPLEMLLGTNLLRASTSTGSP